MRKKIDLENDIFTSDKIIKKIKNLLFSRVVLIFLLLLLQIIFIFFIVLKLNQYTKYLLGGSIGLSFLFMVYISNSNGKNEFKIAWLVPVTLFPLFGLIAYILYHLNAGGRIVKNRLKQVRKETEQFLPAKDTALQILEDYPQVRDIYSYLISMGNYYPDNKTSVSYFKNGESFYPDLISSLRSAKKFIFIEFFIIDIDESWNRIVDILEEKVKEGVEVRVSYDAIGSILASTKTYIEYLGSKGINAQIFMPLFPLFSTQQNNRDHRKIVVIDGKIAYTGGVNISTEYFNMKKHRFDYWKDNAIKIKGPAIKNLTIMFLQTWSLMNYSTDDYEKYITSEVAAESEPGLIAPYGDDAYNHEDIAEDIYLYIINNGKKYIHITSPYIVIDNQMFETLSFAAHRGIDVSIIVPSKPDHILTFCIGKIFLKKLIDQGVNVYLYEQGFIHAKTFVSDDKIATIGSVNLDYRSLYHHFECGALMYDKPAIKEIETDFQETLKGCKKMTAESYKEIPLLYRFIGRALRVFAPLM